MSLSCYVLSQDKDYVQVGLKENQIHVINKPHKSVHSLRHDYEVSGPTVNLFFCETYNPVCVGIC